MEENMIDKEKDGNGGETKEKKGEVSRCRRENQRQRKIK